MPHLFPTVVRWSAANVTLFLALSAPVFAVPLHPGPSIWGEMTMHDDHMVFLIEGAAGPLTTNLGLDTLMIGPLAEEDRQRLREQIGAFFRDNMPVLFDGVRSIPALTDMIIQDGDPSEVSWRSARIVLSFPYESRPQNMSITWHAFAGEGVDYIPIVIKSAPDASPQQFSLWEDEPQYIWHAESVRRHLATPVRMVEGERGKGLPVPVWSALLALAVGVFLCLRRRLKLSRTVTFAVVMSGFAAAGLLWGKGRVNVPLPFSPRIALPAPDQAKQLFAALHQNVYEAFKAETEDGIYDLLATSVDGRLLDEIYGEIYESLILREQGGAVCGIDAVEVVAGSVDPAVYDAADTPEFKVDWTWNVRGLVSHWGHIHRRTNHYRAEYTVRHDGESWKIAAVNVLEHRRVDEDE